MIFFYPKTLIRDIATSWLMLGLLNYLYIITHHQLVKPEDDEYSWPHKESGWGFELNTTSRIRNEKSKWYIMELMPSNNFTCSVPLSRPWMLSPADIHLIAFAFASVSVQERKPYMHSGKSSSCKVKIYYILYICIYIYIFACPAIETNWNLKHCFFPSILEVWW